MIDLKLNKRILLVEVPEEIVCDRIVLNSSSQICYYRDKEFVTASEPIYEYLHKPRSNWGQPIKASEVTEEIWKEIVEYARTFGYRDYDAPQGAYQWCARAKQSGMSLLAHHSLSPDKTILIIENTVNNGK